MTRCSRGVTIYYIVIIILTLVVFSYLIWGSNKYSNDPGFEILDRYYNFYIIVDHSTDVVYAMSRNTGELNVLRDLEGNPVSLEFYLENRYK